MPTILHIDDEKINLELSSIILGKYGYDVVCSTDPRETITLVEQYKPELIILDIVMPEISGFTVFDDLKSQYPPVPILFLTGWPESFDLKESEAVNRWTNLFVDGRTDILYKPYDPVDLKAKIEGLIGPLDHHTEPEPHGSE